MQLRVRKHIFQSRFPMELVLRAFLSTGRARRDLLPYREDLSQNAVITHLILLSTVINQVCHMHVTLDIM